MGIICLFLIESCLEIAALCQEKKITVSLKLHMNSFWLQKTEIKINSSCCLRTALLQERRTQCRYCRTGGFPAQSWRGKSNVHLRLLGRQLRNCKFQIGVKMHLLIPNTRLLWFLNMAICSHGLQSPRSNNLSLSLPFSNQTSQPSCRTEKGHWLKSGSV